MWQKAKLFPLGLIWIAIWCSCTSSRDPNLAGVVVDLNIHRVDSILYGMDSTNYIESADQIIEAYPAFADVFFHLILGFEEYGTPQFDIQMQRFVQSELNGELARLAATQYSDFSPYKEDIREGLRHLKYYFPEVEEPYFYLVISELSIGNFIFRDQGQRDGIGIGLDFFLGDAFPYDAFSPSNEAFSSYLSRTFNSDYLVSKTFELIISDIYGESGGNRLLDMMIHQGKQLYALSRLLPDIQDTVLFKFTGDQMEWVRENEFNIWAYLAGEGLIYESSFRKISKLVSPSPNVPGLPPEAPGGVANFIGFQIVSEYMHQSPSVSIQDLVNLRDAQLILDQSRYRPNF